MIFYSKPLCKQLLDDELVPWRHYVPILDESSVDLLHNFRMLKAGVLSSLMESSGAARGSLVHGVPRAREGSD